MRRTIRKDSEAFIQVTKMASMLYLALIVSVFSTALAEHSRRTRPNNKQILAENRLNVRLDSVPFRFKRYNDRGRCRPSGPCDRNVNNCCVGCFETDNGNYVCS